MRALSVQQPYAYALIHLGKPVENRDWRPSNPGLKFRGRFLIHAGKTIYPDLDDSDFAEMQVRAPHVPITTLADLPKGGIVGTAEIVDVVTDHPSRWFNGPYAFVLSNARPLTFRPCRGMLGFFNVPDDVMALVQEEL